MLLSVSPFSPQSRNIPSFLPRSRHSLGTAAFFFPWRNSAGTAFPLFLQVFEQNPPGDYNSLKALVLCDSGKNFKISARVFSFPSFRRDYARTSSVSSIMDRFTLMVGLVAFLVFRRRGFFARAPSAWTRVPYEFPRLLF